MHDKSSLADFLDPLGLGAWTYQRMVTSTNDLALSWAQRDAPDWSLVLADSQSAGRGRFDRNWVTKPKSALAMSLVLRPLPAELPHLPRFTALAALGLISALDDAGCEGRIKWPNDVLLNGKKVAGILVEAEWQADDVCALVVGMGVNVTDEAVPNELRYPATSVEAELSDPIIRWALLADILQHMMALRLILTDQAFVEAWNSSLAFRGEWISFRQRGKTVKRMKLLGITTDGCLALQDPLGGGVNVMEGEIVMPGA